MDSQQKRPKRHQRKGVRKSGPAQRKLGKLQKGDRIGAAQVGPLITRARRKSDYSSFYVTTGTGTPAALLRRI